MAFITFSPNTIIRSANMNSNFAGIADGSELPLKRVDIGINFIGNITPASAQTTYGDNDSEDIRSTFLFDKSKYTNVQAIYFYAGLSAGVADTVYAELYNVTAAASVAGSEISTNVAALYTNLIISGDIKAGFANASNTYKMRSKTGGVDTGTIANPHLIVDWK